MSHAFWQLALVELAFLHCSTEFNHHFILGSQFGV